jgi:hypothetical protein
MAASIEEWLKSIGWNNSPTAVSRPTCVAFGHAKQIANMMPEPGRDHVSLLRLRSSYKITDTKAIGICTVVGGTNVPQNLILFTQILIHNVYTKITLPNLYTLENRL